MDFYNIGEINKVWSQAPQKAARLQELLGDPVLKEALDIVKMTCAPCFSPDNPSKMAFNSTLCYGRLQAIKALRDIAHPEEVGITMEVEERKLKPEQPTLK